MTRVIACVVLSAAVAAQSGAPARYDSVRAELAAARALPQVLDRALTPVIDRVWEAFDRGAALDQVRFMDQYWRLPGNEGFDRSLDRVKARLLSAGFRDLGTRPAGPVTQPSLWFEPASSPSPGWDQSKGTLAIVRDGRPDEIVLSREKERLALCINSFSTPVGGVTAPLVDVGRGAAADFEGKDVKGAVVVGSGAIGALFTQAVVNRGAIGVVSTAPPAAYIDKNPDILQWGSIPYNEEKKAFGFKATARAADALRKAAAEPNARVRVEVATSFARKPERTLVAEIPGTVAPAERVIVAAHVQEPGANDNASGTATNMELARALAVAMAGGEVPRPARTLTFLWVNEIAGSRRWLTEHASEKDGVRYMFSMDMTGEDVTKTGGHFLVERWPDPGAVWVRPWDPHSEWGAANVRAETLKGDLINDLHLAICERVSKKTGGRWEVRTNPYEGGSDHTQFGAAGIPSVLDWHFTDRFYHSNQDTADKTSADEMRNVGVAVAASAWLMASATQPMAEAAATLVANAGQARVRIEEREGKSLADNAAVVAAWRKWYGEAVQSVRRLVTGPVTGLFEQRLEQLAKPFAGPAATSERAAAGGL